MKSQYRKTDEKLSTADLDLLLASAGIDGSKSEKQFQLLAAMGALQEWAQERKVEMKRMREMEEAVKVARR